MLGQGGSGQASALEQRAVLTDALPEASTAVAPQAGKPGRTALFFVGFLLLLLFAGGAISGWANGSETTKTSRGGEGQTTKAGATKEEKASGASEEAAKAGAKEEQKRGAKEEPKPTTTGSKEEAKKTTNGSTEPKEESSKEVTKNAPSEGLLLALLGTGVALILCGGLYSRLTTVKLPGGVELDLSPGEGEKLKNAVTTKAAEKEDKPDPKKVAEATAVSHAVAKAHQRATGKPLSAEVINLAADIGLKAAGF